MAFQRQTKPLLGDEDFTASITESFAGELRAGNVYDDQTAKGYDTKADGTPDLTKPLTNKTVVSYPFDGLAERMTMRENDALQTDNVFKVSIMNCQVVPEIGDRIEIDDIDGKVIEIITSTPDDGYIEVKVV